MKEQSTIFLSFVLENELPLKAQYVSKTDSYQIFFMNIVDQSLSYKTKYKI